MRLVLSLSALLLAAPGFAAEAKTAKDVPYANTKDKKQTLDVYAPADGKNHPLVVWIHGGGWQSGDKSEADLKPAAFVEKGYVFVSVNYRLLYDATIKQMAGDVAKAIRWTYDHAKDYGGDPGALIVTGHSAGAQLAALVCMDASYLKAEKLALSDVKACIPVDGDTYDVPLQIKTVEKRRADIYTKKFGDAASQKALSPVTHVASKGIPPVLILHVADHPETKLQSLRLVKALNDAGGSAKAFAAEKTDHVKLNVDLGKAGDKPTAALFAFIESSLKKK